MRLLFHFCCSAILTFPWVPRKYQVEIHTLAQSQIKEASCRAFHRRLSWLCALVYALCVSRGRGGDCSSRSSPQSELGQQFQGVLTRDSSSFVTRLFISPHILCGDPFGPGGAGIASWRGEIIRHPSLLSEPCHCSREGWYLSLEKFTLVNHSC